MSNTTHSLNTIIQETEAFLEDIFLSGFHSIRKSTIEKSLALTKQYEKLSMPNGTLLMQQFQQQLQQNAESFQGDLTNITSSFCYLEFYLSYLKNQAFTH